MNNRVSHELGFVRLSIKLDEIVYLHVPRALYIVQRPRVTESVKILS